MFDFFCVFFFWSSKTEKTSRFLAASVQTILEDFTNVSVPRSSCVLAVLTVFPLCTPPAQAVSWQRASMSAVIDPDHTRSPGRHGSGGCCHRQLRHTPHKPRHEPRTEPRQALSGTEPVCGTAPASPRARQDLPHTALICPLLTSLTQEVALHCLGQG